MKALKVLIILSCIAVIVSCASLDEATRKLDKFSTDKTYGLVMFECKEYNISYRITKELSDILKDYGFNIMDSTQFSVLLKKQGLTEQDIINNPAVAMNNIKGVDALIIGRIELENKSVSSGNIISDSGTGGAHTYINKCQSFVFDLTNGVLLANVNYISASLGSSSSTVTPEQVADKIARKLSPH